MNQIMNIKTRSPPNKSSCRDKITGRKSPLSELVNIKILQVENYLVIILTTKSVCIQLPSLVMKIV
nr:MAG TPA: hypothetical protein [Caudoviricetes sp.]